MLDHSPRADCSSSPLTMARAWLINSRGIARKVKNATQFTNFQIKHLEADASRECPNCKHLIDNNDVSLEWPGLPAGVKFDPSDVELLDHLAEKVGVDNLKSHMFIDEFIPTLEVDQGICYTHPENLPGVKKNGSSIHFFHRTSNAYATGQRKRRKIHNECSMSEERVRWHKTGKTKPVFANGIQKGFKKIMVLYRSSKKGCKPDKVNWVMHQYHLGTEEEERDGELVVSKIFYQQSKQMDKSDVDPVNEELSTSTVKTAPETPKSTTPQPPRPNMTPLYDTNKNNELFLTVQDEQHPDGGALSQPLPIVNLKDEGDNVDAWLASESQAVEDPGPNGLKDESLLCHEVLDSFPPIDESSLLFNHHENNERNTNTASGFYDLENIELDTPPDFQLADLQFGSQDSILGWLDRL